MATAKTKPIGKVIHWYDKIGVAVVKLAGSLKVGDTVVVKRGDTEFTDSVTSMQLDHDSIEAGKKGQEVAIKLSQSAKEGAEIYSAE
jgi:translation initiation factor IF-2